MTLFTLERLSTLNTSFFTSLTMYFYEILFCSLILWVKYNKLDFNLILLLFYFFSSFLISFISSHSSFCYYKSEFVRVLDYERNNKGSMLLYNLAAMKNSKMKIHIQDKSKEKQRSSTKITLAAPELVQKKSLSEYWNLNKVSVTSVRNHR